MPMNDYRLIIHGASDLINGAAIGYGANEYTTDEIDLGTFTMPLTQVFDLGIHFRITQAYNNATSIYFYIAAGPASGPTNQSPGRSVPLASAVVGRRIFVPLPFGMPSVRYVRGRVWYIGTAPTTGKCVAWFGPRDGSSNF